MKKLMFLMAMVTVMVFTSGSAVSAQYHPTKVKWYGECSRESAKQDRFCKQFTNKTVYYGKCFKESRKARQFHKFYKERVQKRILAQRPRGILPPIPGSEKYLRRR